MFSKVYFYFILSKKKKYNLFEIIKKHRKYCKICLHWKILEFKNKQKLSNLLQKIDHEKHVLYRHIPVPLFPKKNCTTNTASNESFQQ